MKVTKRIALLLAILAMLSMVAAVPLSQGTQRFAWLITKKLTVQEGGATFQSNVTLDSTADLSLGDDLDITGDLRVGDGTPTITQNGEDLYVNDQLEVDGEAQFDGTVDINGATAIDGGLTNIGGGSYATANGDNDLGIDGDLEVNGTTDLDGALSVAGATTLAAGVTQSDGDVTVADDVIVTAQTAITVTDSAAFTPTGTYQPIQAAGAVTPTITAGATAGTLLVLINTSAQNIKIQDTGNQVLSGDVTMGQYDSLTLWSDGTRWIQVGAESDN